jgi:hypothetical protein
MLCELINQIQPKLIPKINKKTSIAYFSMENIELFLQACAKLGKSIFLIRFLSVKVL